MLPGDFPYFHCTLRKLADVAAESGTAKNRASTRVQTMDSKQPLETLPKSKHSGHAGRMPTSESVLALRRMSLRLIWTEFRRRRLGESVSTATEPQSTRSPR